MTGPLAPLFAQVEERLSRGRDDDELLSGRDFRRAPWDASLAALSSIERHVQELELEIDETGVCRQLCTPEAQRHVQDMESALDPVAIAQAFHEHYERLAPTFGYETRTESAVPWENVPEQNRALMVATVGAVLAALPASNGAPEDESDCNCGGDCPVPHICMPDVPAREKGEE